MRVPPMLPPLPVYGLAGRGALLHQLKERLFSGGNVVVYAEDGWAGVGKTAVALTIAHDPQVQAHFRDGILWAGLQPILAGRHLDEAGRRTLHTLSLFPPKPGTFSATDALDRAAVTLPTHNGLTSRVRVACAEPGRYYLHPAVACGRRQMNSVVSYQ